MQNSMRASARHPGPTAAKKRMARNNFRYRKLAAKSNGMIEAAGSADAAWPPPSNPSSHRLRLRAANTETAAINAAKLNHLPYVPANYRARPTIEGPNVTATDLSAGPIGLTPTQMRDAYGLEPYGSSPITFKGIQGDGTGQTIALVDVYDYPTALSDLNAFSTQFGLPNFNGMPRADFPEIWCHRRFARQTYDNAPRHRSDRAGI